MNENITVLPDESLGGVLREYREVKRQVRVGERAAGLISEGLREYVVLEPTDIVYVDDADGVSRKYRMVDREAVVGERVIIVNEGSESFGGLYYRIGNVGTVTVGANTRKNIRVDFSENDEYHGDGRWIVSPGDYRVLERRDNLKARGKTKEILKKVGEVQLLIGSAISRIDTLSQYEIRALLENAHDLCIEIRNMYEPVD